MSGRVSDLYKDLLVDRVISAGAAYRLYRVPIRAARAEGISVLTRTARQSTSARRRQRVSFLTLDDDLEGVRVGVLRHLAAATAARLHLGASADDWSNDAGRPLGAMVPDAIWRRSDSPTGAWAIEVDTGSYERALVTRKAAEFASSYGWQVWTSVSEIRAARLRAALVSVGAPSNVYVVQWW